MTDLLSAVPVIPARDVVESAAWGGIAPESCTTSLTLGVDGVDDLYADCRAQDLVRPECHLEEQPWCFREFSVDDVDGDVVTFVEPPAGCDPREEGA